MSSVISILESRIREHLNPHFLDIRDDSHKHAGHAGNVQGGGHYHVTIHAHMFEGRTRIQCHQMVYALFSDMIPHPIHALSMTVSV